MEVLPLPNSFSRLPDFAIIAHRGSSLYAPENTLTAFETAIKQKAHATEFDVSLCKDKEVVVIHGPKVDRTTNGHGFVKTLSLDELKKLDAGSHFDPIFSSAKIPTLQEVFESLGGKIVFNIELKDYFNFTGLLAKKVANLVKKYRLEDWVVISSFSPIALLQFHHYLPQTPICILALKGARGSFSRNIIPRIMAIDGIHPYFEDLSAKYLAWATNHGWRVYAYKINTPQQIKQLFKMGVNGIITDDPMTALKIHSEMNTN